jgi:hypothetical protein
MSDTKSSQSQHASPFTKPLADGVARAESAFAEYGKLEEKMLEHAVTGIDEAARLSKESLAYGAALMTEWRKLTLEATRRAASMMTVPGFAGFGFPGNG